MIRWRRAWLETIHLITTLPAWSRNLTRRVKRHPKVFVTDPGLAAWLLGKTADASLFHWQDRSGAEVDIVIEAADGRVAALEVKTGQTAKPEWFRWLAQMRDTLGGKFTTGIALYAGNEVLPFGDRLLAIPISALWEFWLWAATRTIRHQAPSGTQSGTRLGFERVAYTRQLRAPTRYRRQIQQARSR